MEGKGKEEKGGGGGGDFPRWRTGEKLGGGLG